jgi:hypothetical protein
MALSRSVLAAAAAAVVLPFSAPVLAGELTTHGGDLAFAAPGAPSAKSREAARAELAQARADGTLARYQSLRNPPAWGVRNKDQLRADLHGVKPVVSASAAAGPRGAGLSVPRWTYGG